MKEKLKNNKNKILLLSSALVVILLLLLLLQPTNSEEPELFFGYGSERTEDNSEITPEDLEEFFPDLREESLATLGDDDHGEFEVESRTVTYTSPNGEHTFELEVGDHESTLIIPGTSTQIDEIATASWSEDSAYILFSLNEEFSEGHTDSENFGNIWTINPDGTNRAKAMEFEGSNSVSYVGTTEYIYFVTLQEIGQISRVGGEKTTIQNISDSVDNIFALPTIELTDSNTLWVDIDLDQMEDDSELINI